MSLCLSAESDLHTELEARVILRVTSAFCKDPNLVQVLLASNVGAKYELSTDLVVAAAQNGLSAILQPLLMRNEKVRNVVLPSNLNCVFILFYIRRQSTHSSKRTWLCRRHRSMATPCWRKISSQVVQTLVLLPWPCSARASRPQ